MKKDKILILNYDKEQLSQDELENMAKTLKFIFEREFPDILGLFLPYGVSFGELVSLEQKDIK